VTKGDIYRDDMKRTQRLRSEGRRRGRLRRKSTFLLLILGFLSLLVVAAPSLVCQSPLAKSFLTSTLAKYGFEGGVASIQIGWVTPLRIEGLALTGTTAGSQLLVDRVETDVTILKCISGLSDLGEIAVRGVVVDIFVTDGHSSLEDDIAILLAEDQPDEEGNSNDPSSSMLAKISAKNVAVRVTDSVTKTQWIADQSKADIDLNQDKIDITFSTVMTDPTGGSGEMEGRIQYPMEAGKPYELNLVTQRIPLSLALLVKRRLGESGVAIPAEISGDTTGSMTVSGGVGDAISVSVTPMEFRNFVASDPSFGDRIWRNGLTAISGSVTIDGDRILGRHLQLTTDFGNASFNGAFNTSMSLAGQTNPAAWLESLDGSAGAAIDLVAFEKALPGLIPLRDQVEITAGNFSAEVTSAIEAGSIRRSHWNLKTQPIRAIASGRAIAIEPAILVASLRVTGGQFSADSLRLQSAFANASADGDLARGRIKGDIQFSRLAAMIQPLLDMPEISLVGQATGEMNWAADAGDLWRLDGKAEASDLVITLPGGINFQQPSLRGEIDASGRWSDGTLRQMDSLEMSLATSGLEASASLTEKVFEPSTTTPLPLRMQGRGRLEALAGMLGPWMPTSIHSLKGGFTANAIARVAMSSGEVTSAKIQIEEPRIGYGEQLYLQPQLLVDFDGRYAWPEGSIDAKKMSVVGEALSAAIQGTMNASGMNFEVAWRAKLDRLQGAMRPSLALTSEPAAADTRPVAFRPEAASTVAAGYEAIGDCEGRFTLTQKPESTILLVDAKSTGNNVKLFNSVTSTTPETQPSAPVPVWAERLINLDTQLGYDLNDGKINAEKIQFATDWFATTLAGKALWSEEIGDVAMNGTARIKMPEVASKLSTMLGMTIRLDGLHETPIEIAAARKGDGPLALAVNANVGWESGEVAGIKFGSTTIPVTMNETTVSIKPATIPVEQGRLQLAGDLYYSPGPMWMSLKPGVVAEDLTLTPELTNQWLQYVAPMVANSARVEGTFGVELIEANVNLEDTMASKVRGNLRIKGVNLDSGPVANQIIGSIKQIQQIARGMAADTTPQRDRRLVTFPTQAVDFEFANGVVSHQRMVMEVDRASIITGGQVNVDGRLNLVAQVPLDPSWLGSDLKGFAGQTITLPIDGTLSRPSLDSAGIRRLVTEMGTKALQSTAESYLEKQLGRGFDKLLGR